jgi:hypothetical protein
LFARISARLYPIDPMTGLRIYNPDGKFTISVDEDGQAATDHQGDEALGGESSRSRIATSSDGWCIGAMLESLDT